MFSITPPRQCVTSQERCLQHKHLPLISLTGGHCGRKLPTSASFRCLFHQLGYLQVYSARHLRVGKHARDMYNVPRLICNM